jgi:hypothetical protein
MKPIEELKKFVGKNFLSVKKLEGESVKNLRMNICKSCPNYNEKKDTCTVCGCLMKIKTGLLTNRNPKKLRIEKTHCPEGFWNDKETVNHYRKIDGKPLLN